MCYIIFLNKICRYLQKHSKSGCAKTMTKNSIASFNGKNSIRSSKEYSVKHEEFL